MFTQPNSGFLVNPLHPLSRDLIGWWVLNEGSGTFVQDYSFNENHGTLENFPDPIPWTGNTFGRGLLFDNTDDSIQLGDDLVLLDTNLPYGISWWERAVSDNGSSTYNRCGFRVQISPGLTDQLGVFRSSNASYDHVAWGQMPNTLLSLTAAGAPSLTNSTNVWRNFVITGTSPLSTTPGDHRIWVDGIEYSIANGGSFADIGSHNRLGQISTGVANAYLSDFRLYNRLLNEYDAIELYTNPFGNVLTNKFPKFIQGLAATAPTHSTGRHLRRRRLLHARY